MTDAQTKTIKSLVQESCLKPLIKQNIYEFMWDMHHGLTGYNHGYNQHIVAADYGVTQERLFDLITAIQTIGFSIKRDDVVLSVRDTTGFMNFMIGGPVASARDLDHTIVLINVSDIGAALSRGSLGMKGR